LNPSSYDLTLGKNALFEEDAVELGEDGFMLEPGKFILLTSQQYFKFPCDLSGQLLLKSTIGRCGIDHMLAGWIDPDFCGNVTMELYNTGHLPFRLYEGQRIAQIVFHMLPDPTEKPYRIGGRYHGQVDVTAAREETEESSTVDNSKMWVAGPWIDIDNMVGQYVKWDYKMLQRYGSRVDYDMSKVSSRLKTECRNNRRDQKALGRVR
tara:strand:+ start:133050 stop:133673 length:624 start_codon:yes stop_codon:yes gene_type:complete